MPAVTRAPSPAHEPGSSAARPPAQPAACYSPTRHVVSEHEMVPTEPSTIKEGKKIGQCQPSPLAEALGCQAPCSVCTHGDATKGWGRDLSLCFMP